MPVYRLGSTAHEVHLEPLDEAQGLWRLRVGDTTHTVRVLHREGARWYLDLDGQQVVVDAQWLGTRGWVTHRGHTWQAERGPRARGQGREAPGGDGTLRAPMPAQVRAVQVEVGQTVAAGQTLLLLEAMKMELRIQAPFDGVVQTLTVRAGDTVEREQVLAVVAPRDDNDQGRP